MHLKKDRLKDFLSSIALSVAISECLRDLESLAPLRGRSQQRSSLILDPCKHYMRCQAANDNSVLSETVRASKISRASRSTAGGLGPQREWKARSGSQLETAWIYIIAQANWPLRKLQWLCSTRWVCAVHTLRAQETPIVLAELGSWLHKLQLQVIDEDGKDRTPKPLLGKHWDAADKGLTLS